LNTIASPAARDPGPLVTLVLSLTVEKVDSIGLDVFRCTQCLAGKSKKASSCSWSPMTFATAFGYAVSPDLIRSRKISQAQNSRAVDTMLPAQHTADWRSLLGRPPGVDDDVVADAADGSSRVIWCLGG
jgi:hypothetical protein